MRLAVIVALIAWVPVSLWLTVSLERGWGFPLGCSAGLAVVTAAWLICETASP